MRRLVGTIEARVLPRGWRDLIRQIALFVAAFMLYNLVRGLFGNADSYKPFGDAMKIINFERVLHVFAEPAINSWAQHQHLLIDAADWTYLNGHFLITLAVLVFIYLRRNDSFYFVRNMFMIAMALALVGYAVYPTAPPRLMPEWGFTDSVSHFMFGSTRWMDQSPTLHAFTNFYAAVPSMHVCFAIIVGWSMVRLSSRRAVKVVWSIYPLLITFVVVATANHYFTDVFLGAITAGASALLAKQLLARARPDAWAFSSATA